MLEKTLSKLSESLSSQGRTGKIKVRTDYRLTKSSEFRLWMDDLRNELETSKLLDVIDSDVDTEAEFSFEERIERERKVRAVIMGRLDDDYHGQVLGMSEPRKILAYLKKQRRLQSNLTHTTVRTRLSNMRMNPRERAADFINRFHALVREYEDLEDAEKLSSRTLTTYFFNPYEKLSRVWLTNGDRTGR